MKIKYLAALTALVGGLTFGANMPASAQIHGWQQPYGYTNYNVYPSGYGAYSPYGYDYGYNYGYNNYNPYNYNPYPNGVLAPNGTWVDGSVGANGMPAWAGGYRPRMR